MGARAFNAYVRENLYMEIETETESITYRNSSVVWTPDLLLPQEEQEESEEEYPELEEPVPFDFYDQPVPRDQHRANERIMKGMKGLGIRIEGVRREVKEFKEETSSRLDALEGKGKGKGKKKMRGG